MPCEDEKGNGGGLVGVLPPSVRVRLPLEGWTEQNESSVNVVCQGCRWRGIAVRGTTGTPSTVPLTLYSIPTLWITSQLREREGFGGWGKGWISRKDAEAEMGEGVKPRERKLDRTLKYGITRQRREGTTVKESDRSGSRGGKCLPL